MRDHLRLSRQCSCTKAYQTNKVKIVDKSIEIKKRVVNPIIILTKTHIPHQLFIAFISLLIINEMISIQLLP